MPVGEAPDDDDDRIRQTYNFAPGYHGLIYRANTSDRGAGSNDRDETEAGNDDGPRSPNKAHAPQSTVDGRATHETKYKLQAARWGLIPFWTKRAPDYGSQMKTINCRDDSLIENRGMWNTMKQRKRCVVVAEGFFEWLKKNNGKEKIPHFTKRKDGQLTCFAGMYDMVQFDGSQEKLYTYTIITTDSNRQLKFLHDRMPVILEPGSEAMRMWLDPNNIGWSKELQSLLRPFDGGLDCYPVDKGVGKVGNNNPSFVIPVDSKDNKKNIANFFGNQKALAKGVAMKNEVARVEEEAKAEGANVKDLLEENRDTTTKVENTENNAPLPKPEGVSEEELSQRIKEDTAEVEDQDIVQPASERVERGIKRESDDVDDDSLLKAAQRPVKKATKLEQPTLSPVKSASKTRSAISNNNIARTPTKGNAKITSFFAK
ncbi:hypothetical protein DOTSEDRAFT_22594 [Dothistroma septosporum NZE10]|uniref:DUF159 domain protein n=1 Tax=Dothistroma septosporum (strain NZE10 / CBS 128990) TaxID=675120 RepID=N1PVV8_DOTSN|nr:hypothetical protein DOTSEDRAFT_22594 [Dothistroma septosporum NZE10]